MGVGRRVVARAVLVPVVAMLCFLIASSIAAAETRFWTTQADFASGTLRNLDSQSQPGNLVLSLNDSSFAKEASNPVLTPGVPGSWEGDSINGVSVLGERIQYKMWYAGCSGFSPFFTCAIGYATSPDGVVWAKYSGNPVLNATGTQGTAELPVVIFDAGVYKMWFESHGTPGLVINFATSTDGITWTQYAGNPVYSGGPGWDSQSVANPIVIRSGGELVMYFSGEAGDYVYQIGRAFSKDGISWTEDPYNPLLTMSDTWEQGPGVFSAGVLENSTGFVLYYSAGYATSGAFGRAFSPDGRNWTRDPSNPILTIDSAGWDSLTLGAGKFIAVGTRQYAWFAGKNPSSNGWSYGLATTPAYGPRGTFRTAVFDSGGNGTTWTWLNATLSLSISTQVSLSLREGDLSNPDSSWTPWASFGINSTLTGLPRTRYAQLEASLSTEDGLLTPVLQEVQLGYVLDRVYAPEPKSVGSANWTNRSSPDVSWVFTDPDSGDSQSAYQVQIASDGAFSSVIYDSGVVIGSSSTAQIGSDLTDGTWYWRVRTQDNWGTWSAYGNTSAFHVDTIAPAVVAGYGSPSAIVNGLRYIATSTLIWLNATDGVTGSGVSALMYGVDGAPDNQYLSPFRVTGADGTHFVLFSVVDKVGNTGNGIFLSVIDNSPPTSGLAVRPEGSGFEVTVTSEDGGSGVSSQMVSVDDGAWFSYVGAIRIEQAGLHIVRAFATDALGNRESPKSVQFTIPNVQPYVSGPLGLSVLALVAALLRRATSRGRWALSAAGFLGGFEVVIAAASAGVGTLAIPPWSGVSVWLDGALSAASFGLIVAALLDRQRKRIAAAGAEPPA